MKKSQVQQHIYLIFGDDTHQANRSYEDLLDALSKSVSLDIALEQYSLEEANLETIISAAQTQSLFSETHIVVANKLDALPASASAPLIALIENLPASTILILRAHKLAKNTKLYKVLASNSAARIVECTAPKAYSLPNLVINMAKEHQLKLTERAARLLIDLVGEDTQTLNNELVKIALNYQQNSSLGEREIEDLVHKSSEPKPWTLTDSIMQKNLSASLRTYDAYVKTSPHQLVFHCASMIKNLLITHTCLQQQGSSQVAKVLGMADWQAKKYLQAARNFNPQELRSLFKNLQEAELAMKSGSNPKLVLRQWIVLACTKDVRA